MVDMITNLDIYLLIDYVNFQLNNPSRKMDCEDGRNFCICIVSCDQAQ